MPNTPDAPPGRKGPNWPGIIVVAIMAILIAGQAGQVNALLMVAGVVALALNGLWFIKRLSTFERQMLAQRYVLALISGGLVGAPVLEDSGAGMAQIQGLFFVLVAICAFAGGGVLAAYVDLKKMMGQEIQTGLQHDGLEPKEREKFHYQYMNPALKLMVDLHQAASIVPVVIIAFLVFESFLQDVASDHLSPLFLNIGIMGITWFAGLSVIDVRNGLIKRIVESNEVAPEKTKPSIDEEQSVSKAPSISTAVKKGARFSTKSDWHAYKRELAKAGIKRHGSRVVENTQFFTDNPIYNEKENPIYGSVRSGWRSVPCLTLEQLREKYNSDVFDYFLPQDAPYLLLSAKEDFEQLHDSYYRPKIQPDIVCHRINYAMHLAGHGEEGERFMHDLEKNNVISLDHETLKPVWSIAQRFFLRAEELILPEHDRVDHDFFEKPVNGQTGADNDTAGKPSKADASGFDPSAFGRPATPANEPETAAQEETPQTEPDTAPEDVDEVSDTDEERTKEADYQKIINDPESPPELRRRALEDMMKLQAKRDDD